MQVQTNSGLWRWNFLAHYDYFTVNSYQAGFPLYSQDKEEVSSEEGFLMGETD